MATAALTVDLNARIAQFETEMKRATGSLDKFEKKGNQLAASFKTAFGALAASVSVGMFVGFIKGSIDAQDAISKLSQKTGIAVESLAGLQHAADLSDVGVEQLAKGIRTFGVVVAESERGMKSYQDKLTMLGLDYKKLNDLSPEEQFYALADAVKALGKEDRAVAVSGALGDRLSALVPLLSGGADELRKMVEEGKKYNPVTAESARLAEEFNDNLTRLKASAGAAGVSIATDLLPSLANTADRVRELMDEDKGVQALVRAFAGLGKIPFDLIFGDIAAATTAQGRIKELKDELNGLQRDLKSSQTGGGKSSVVMRSIFGTPEEINQQITVIKNQIASLEKFGEKVYKPKAKPGATPDKPTTTPTTSGSKADPQGAFVAKLKQEAETLGLTGEALQRYEAIKLKLTGSNAKLADSYIAQIAAFKKAAGDQEFMNMVMQDGQNTINEANQNMRDWEETVKSASQELTDMVSPVNVLIRQLTELDKFDGFVDPEILAAARLELNAQIDGLGQVDDKLTETKSLAEEIGLTFTSAFEDAVAGGESFSNVLKALERDLIKLATRKAITEPLMKAIDGIDFGALFSGATANAKGGIYSSPSLSAYSGSVVSSPTLFKFASGAGLMGEAGAEAILPLKRGPNGKLGVEGGMGGGVQVNVINNANGTQASTKERQENGVRVIDVMVEQVEGAIGRRMSRGEGLAPTMERRYGLNPSAGAMR